MRHVVSQPRPNAVGRADGHPGAQAGSPTQAADAGYEYFAAGYTPPQ